MGGRAKSNLDVQGGRAVSDVDVTLRKSHGGSVKRKGYANGGSVRDARY
jgi:hypothetical protein